MWSGLEINTCVLVFLVVFRLLPELAEHEVAPALFQSLLPPEVNRKTVSTTFQRLLGKGSVSFMIRLISVSGTALKT